MQRRKQAAWSAHLFAAQPDFFTGQKHQNLQYFTSYIFTPV
jgi:hypothetical protein